MAFRRGRERGRYRVGALGGLLALLAVLALLGGLILLCVALFSVVGYGAAFRHRFR